MELVADLRRGWRASVGVILIAALFALPVSAVFAFVASAAGLGGGALVGVTGALQLLLTYWIAGRRSRNQ